MRAREPEWLRPMLIGAGVLAASMAPWPGLGGAFTSAWCALLEPLLQWCDFDAASVHLVPGSAALLSGREHATWHAVVEVSSTVSSVTTRFGLNLRGVAWVPTAAFGALALAWPFARTRSWPIVANGFALVQLYCLLGVCASIALMLSADRVRVWSPDPFWASALRTLFESFVVPPAMAYAISGAVLTTLVLGWPNGRVR